MADPRVTSRPSGSNGIPTHVVSILRRDLPLVVLDAVIVAGVYLALLVVRFDGAVPSSYWRGFRVFIVIVLSVHLLSNASFGLYGQMWQHASVQEARRLLLAGAAAFMVVVIVGVVGDGRVVPRLVAVVGPLLALLGFGVLRFQSRLFAFHRSEAKAAEHRNERVLLYGTGEAGAAMLRDIRRDPGLGLRVVGLIDDDPRCRGLSLHGLVVLGDGQDIPRLVERLAATQVLLAIPSADSDLIRRVAARCEDADVRLRVLPSVREIVGGTVTARDIRDLSIEDLLGRQQVQTDLATVRALLSGRRVLVTGAGGSIGSEIARQVADFQPAQLLLVDHDETLLFDVAEDLPIDVPRRQVLLDVRDGARVAEAFAELAPDVVFHAAANKHVPILEQYPREAALTNVLGTANVVDAATAAHVPQLVFISTDKAIRPVSVMGASKRMAEEVVRGFTGNGTVACCVRFGNVVGSRGSVIPTFLHQIQRGGPVTVTDPRMTRYFMSIPEAVQLVLQAAALSEGGEIFTLDMGEPVNILDLAKKVIRLSGRVPDRDVPIVITGARPGERLNEEVRDPDEVLVPSAHPAISVTRANAADRPALRHAIGTLETLCSIGDDEALASYLRTEAAGQPTVSVREEELAAGRLT
jgi:FlaA1/EpsC-like NDP-sugar epimerase